MHSLVCHTLHPKFNEAVSHDVITVFGILELEWTRGDVDPWTNLSDRKPCQSTQAIDQILHCRLAGSYCAEYDCPESEEDAKECCESSISHRIRSYDGEEECLGQRLKANKLG